jgi:hypothetical protein
MMKRWRMLLAVVAFFATACGAATQTAGEGVTGQPEAAIETPATQSLPDTPTPHLLAGDIIAPTPSGLDLQPLLAEADINMDEVVALLPPDAIPAISPEEAMDFMVTAEAAEQAGTDPDVRLIGVSINGDSQAFPLPFLSRHEIVNTEIGGRQLAVTW